MAYTYTTLKAAIQDFVEDSGSTFIANLDNFIQNAEQRIFSEVDLPLDRKNSTGNLTTANKYLATPEDFLSTYSLSVISNNTHHFLLNKDVNFVQTYNPDPSVKGLPKYYSLWDDNTFIVGPCPDQAYEVELHYYYKPESITTSATGNSWLGTNAQNALLYGSLVEAYTFLKGEPDLIKLYNDRYREALSRLKNLGEGRNRTDEYRSTIIRQRVT
jgi:hypothetical protein|tara:strand:+ start:8924 stop:9568 length:645 start_codon:yes stop_codon:yes gene_type:complete